MSAIICPNCATRVSVVVKVQDLGRPEATSDPALASIKAFIDEHTLLNPGKHATADLFETYMRSRHADYEITLPVFGRQLSLLGLPRWRTSTHRGYRLILPLTGAPEPEPPAEDLMAALRESPVDPLDRRDPFGVV